LASPVGNGLDEKLDDLLEHCGVHVILDELTLPLTHD